MKTLSCVMKEIQSVESKARTRLLKDERTLVESFMKQVKRALKKGPIKRAYLSSGAVANSYFGMAEATWVEFEHDDFIVTRTYARKVPWGKGPWIYIKQSVNRS